MNINIIIMSGGLGKRMESKLPKVLHKVKEIPMVVRVIKESMKLNPKNLLLVVGKYKNIIKKTLKEYNVLEKITFIIQEEPLGTGHAIQCCKDFLFINCDKDDKVLVLSGDTPMITHKLMKDMLFFENVKMMYTKRENPEGYGRVQILKGEFMKIVEHKDCNEKELKNQQVNCGIYSFRNELLSKYLSYIKNDNAQKEYYLTDLMEILKNYGHYNIELYYLEKEYQKQLIGVNTKEQLNKLNKSF
jgi:bifunctional UDP-N-acetylglucosamine pyrophosphorylase/glucosamine-1-phosphate N-acetyltransferase